VGVEECKNHLHNRVWSSLAPWKSIPFGTGFYEFKFSSLEDICDRF